MKYKCSGCGELLYKETVSPQHVSFCQQTGRMAHLIPEEEQMSDCDIGRTISEKIQKEWREAGFNCEAIAVGKHSDGWTQASYLCTDYKRRALTVFREICAAAVTTKEIDCLHRNLSKEAFAATGLKAPEPQTVGFVVSKNKICYILPSDPPPREGEIEILGGSAYLKNYYVELFTLLGVDLDDLANQKLRKLDEWASTHGYYASPVETGCIRHEIARLLKEPVSFKKGV